jgi:hypothetical protein
MIDQTSITTDASSAGIRKIVFSKKPQDYGHRWVAFRGSRSNDLVAKNWCLTAMKSECYLVERFNNPPPVLGTGFPLSPYAFIVHFREPVTFSDDEAQKRASATVAYLLHWIKATCTPWTARTKMFKRSISTWTDCWQNR